MLFVLKQFKVVGMNLKFLPGNPTDAPFFLAYHLHAWQSRCNAMSYKLKTVRSYLIKKI